MALGAWLDTFIQDVTFGVRSLRRYPVVVCATILTQTMGIGLSAGIFALINAILLRPPVEKDPGSFIRLYAHNSQPSFHFGQPGAISLEDYRVYERAHSLTELTAWHQVRPVFGAAHPLPLRAVLVSCNFFSLYGLEKPEMGRLFLPEECSGASANSVAVISDEMWRTTLNADPKILGRVIVLNRRPFTVIGVTPPHFSGRMSFRFSGWIPMFYPMVSQLEQGASAGTDFVRDPSIQWLAVEGRRRPGYSIRAVQSELSVLAQHQDALHPGRKTELFVTDGSSFEEPGERSRNQILLLLLIGSLLLLVAIASANVASLLLAKAAVRRKEAAIRLTLGASRSRLFQMLLIESLLLACPAGIASLYIAFWLPRFLSSHLLKEPLSIPVGPDFRVFAYLAGAALMAGCIATLTPATESLKKDHLAALNGQEEVPGSGISNWIGRNLLISAQLAASFVALIGAGMFVEWHNVILNGDPGFEASRVLAVPLNLQTPQYDDITAARFYQALEQRLAELPRIESLCYTDTPPFEGSPTQEFRVRGQRLGTGHSAMVSVVSIGCLATLNIDATYGRTFHRSDISATTSAPVVVVSEAFARSWWPQENAIDKSIVDATGTTLRVVGVVHDTKFENFGATDGPRIYRLEAHPRLGDSLLFSFKGDSSSLAIAVESLVKSLDPDLIAIPRTVRSQIDEVASAMQGVVNLMLLLAGGTVLLALIGIYGVVWFSVSRRTKEMGIRTALGATKWNLIVQILWSNVRPVLVGLAAGLVLAVMGSYAMGRISTDEHFPTEILNSTVYFVAMLLLPIVAVSAMLGPAIRVVQQDPVAALRQE